MNELTVAIDTFWVLVCGILVFFMNAGFGLLETGLTRAKNAVNILSKNFVVFAIASLGFWIIGWGLMFGDGNGFFGTKGLFFLLGNDNSPMMKEAYQGVYSAISWTGIPLFAKFFFQLAFAATAATIVSGCVAERVKFVAFLVFSFVIVTILYPIVGHWTWGGGWLSSLGFYDFAGSTVVHSVGGWAGFMAILVLGPRIGKYTKNGEPSSIPGHNLIVATLGCFVLWLGWYGFNPGSTMAIASTAGAIDVSRIFLTTSIAASCGILSSTAVSWMVLGKPDLTMILNGALAGLVAITAPCFVVSLFSSALIGIVAGVLVVFAIIKFDEYGVDDPVGALSVHLTNGIWGTLSVGIFASDAIGGAGNGLLYGGGLKLLGIQLLGVVSVGVFISVLSFLFLSIIKAVLGLRVSRDEELRGLDIDEHGLEAYPDFQTFITK